MQKTEKLEKRERIYYKGCTLLVLLFEFLTGISAVLSVVDFIRVVFLTPQDLWIGEIGNYLYFSVTNGYSYTPIGGHIPDGLNPKTFAAVWIAVQFLTSMLPYLIFFESIRRMLCKIAEGHSPLNIAAVRDIKTAGAAMVYVAVCRGIIEQAVMGLVIYGRVIISNPISIPGLFGGLLILLFAGIYRRGCALQQDADETI